MKRIILILILSVALVFSIFTTATAGQERSLVKTDTEYKRLEKQINEIIAPHQGTYGINLLDLNTGKTLAVNAGEQFFAASTIKLPVNLYLHKEIENNHIDPGQKLELIEKHMESGTGILQEKEEGSQFTIEELSKYSIVYSDNVATNMILEHVGMAEVKDFMRSMGGQIVKNGENITCPADMTIYMQEILNFSSQSETGQKLMQYLQNTIYNERIPAPLPEGTRVAHKIGNWPPTNTYSDVGYIEHPEHPYILSVFCKNTPSRNESFKVFREISETVYNYQDNFTTIDIKFNGKIIEPVTPPVIINDRVLVPVRTIAESFNAGIEWDGSTETVTVTKEDKEIVLRINKTTALIDEKETPLETPPQLVNNRTMIPLRFTGEAMDAGIRWDNKEKTVFITVQ